MQIINTGQYTTSKVYSLAGSYTFLADHPIYDTGMYFYDQNSQTIRDILEGTDYVGWYISFVTHLNNELYFTMWDYEGIESFYAFDGVNLRLLEGVMPNIPEFNIERTTLYRGQIAYFINDQNDSSGALKVYLTNGTAAGTSRVLFDNYVDESYLLGDARLFVELNDNLLFFGNHSSNLFLESGHNWALCKLAPNYLSTSTMFTTNLNVYPNPSAGRFAIELDDMMKDVSVTVLDLSGRIIEHKSEQKSNQILIDMTGNSGVYVVQLENERGVFTKQMILH